ncbi:MAG: ribbon-helix-helix protein, CopG family [Nitrospirae bacterium]|nr:ribbon-helix-helix protein, CopG family [Nitrospirota bacterium]
MKVKTSITLSEELIHGIDEMLGEHQKRSEFIERAVRDYMEKQSRKERNQRDLDILNKKADKLNREAEDVLLYQIDL